MFPNKILTYETILFLSLFIPFFTGIFANISKFSVRFKKNGIIFLSFLQISNLFSLLFAVKNSGLVSITLFGFGDVNINFFANKLQVIFCLFMAILWLVTNIYSFGYVDNENCRDKIPYIKGGRYYLFMSLSICFATGAAFSGNLLSLYICYELLSFATYPLVSITGTEHALKAAKKYLLFLVSCSILFFLPAIIYTYLKVGNISFSHEGFLPHQLSNFEAYILFILFVLGIAKTAIFPLSFWLPIAMAAPHPVSSLLHAVAVVKTGVFALVKICIFTFGIEFLYNIFYEDKFLNIPMILAVFTIIYSSIRACMQVQIKKILAFSTIAHLSICLMALFLFTKDSIESAFIYMMAHGVTKISLFFIAGFYYTKYKVTDVIDLSGMYKKEKMIFYSFLIASLSLIGFPLFACFKGKFMIFSNLAQNQPSTNIIAILYVISSCFTAYYMMNMLYIMVLEKSDKARHGVPHSQIVSLFVMKIAIIVSSILIIIFPLISMNLNL